MIMMMLLMNQYCSPWNVKVNEIQELTIMIIKLIVRSNEARDELTLSANDNDDAPDEPMLLSMECGNE